MQHRWNRHEVLWNLAAMTLIAAWLPRCALGAIVRRGMGFNFSTSLANSSLPDLNVTASANASSRFSSGDFPVCTDLKGPFVPFCLPENGADVLVDTTYYITWNADFYPLNATITIELRYSDSLDFEASSAFTSEKTDNSYGYYPLHMSKDWLQGKPNNTLTLYIIELDSNLDRRASARQGPMITLHPRPVEHYRPSPPPRFNNLALYIGLPVALVVVIIVVVTLVFSMRRSREAITGIWNSRRRGYGIGKSRSQRLRSDRRESNDSDDSAESKRYPNDIETGLLEGTGAEGYSHGHERGASYPFRRDVSRLKTWMKAA
ncbi:hypothetical protein BJY04DRAFT_177242 [Aspergillus karnatakaensis]|uniref:DUF4448 domain-containing protein n=1 Tax=Aspergillus karnatakaensis TaxID=1810916 RepID=UPI003CCD4476